MNALLEVLTSSEADMLWNLPKCTVKRDAYRGRFNKDEMRKSKGTFLVLRSAMYRIYGEPRKVN